MGLAAGKYAHVAGPEPHWWLAWQLDPSLPFEDDVKGRTGQGVLVEAPVAREFQPGEHGALILQTIKNAIDRIQVNLRLQVDRTGIRDDPAWKVHQSWRYRVSRRLA